MTLAVTAMTAAAFMLAHQVAGKAARDALFLSQYEPASLPKMVVGGALAALLLSSLFSNALERFSPRRVVPLTFLASALLHALEWFFLPSSPGVVVVLVYLHILGLGAILLSGFWALASELFDPREAKGRFGSIAGTGTAGGIAGGLLAERTAAWFSTDSVLLLLAILHIACGVILLSLPRPAAAPFSKKPLEPPPSRVAVFRRAPYLLSLAVLVIIGTTSAAMLDFLFKSGAAQEFGKSPALLRYFALFYTGAQVLTFLVQTVLSRASLEHLGLSRTVGALPLGVGAGSIVALAIPGFASIASARALELILRGSLFRAGYELFYTPVPAPDKRSVKVLIDVGCDRLGDATGAGIVQFAMWMGPSLARTELLLAAAALASIAGYIASRLDKAYSIVLERGLIQRAIELDFTEIHDSTTRNAALNSGTVTMASGASTAQGNPRPSPEPPARQPARPDALLTLLGNLRSGDRATVRHALRDPLCEDPLAVPQMIRLIAWDDVFSRVQSRLTPIATRIAGQLSDALLDPKEDFAIRRRIPRLLARCTTSQRAADALAEGLNDSRFEVRFQCGRALDALRQKNPQLQLREAAVFQIIEGELSVSKSIWAGHRLLDRRESHLVDSSERFLFLDELLLERANQSLEHVFSLLALVLPREPLKVAFRALHTDDRQIRGLALEYLESVLPAGIREKLFNVLDEGPATPSTKSPRQVFDDLMLSNATLQWKIQSELTDPKPAPPA